MANISIGITAMELFACNPYRVIGVPVDSTQDEITGAYTKVLSLSESNISDQYKTPFDFDSLPPLSRTPQALKTAYAKISSNGYRCFAYSYPQFPIALNIDDVALNLRDVTCYDCFLRCYMWLVINDRHFEETELWILLAKYIDKLIVSSPDKWTTYFDHRFPQAMIDPKLQIYKSFYTTFCEIILLPLKEMVRGSMKCTTATEILKVAKVNIDEVFPVIEIPQANLPKRGESVPLLKIAVKETDELVTEEDDAVEHNEFDSVAVAPLTADEIFEEESPKVVAPAPAPNLSAGKVSSLSDRVDSLLHKKKAPEPVAPSPVENAPIAAATISNDDAVVGLKIPKPATPPHKAAKIAVEPVEDIAVESEAVPEDIVTISAPKKSAKQLKTRTSLIDGAEVTSDTTKISLSDEKDEDEEQEENIYTDALIRMLRSNRVHNQLMRDVDTRHSFNNGDSLDDGNVTPDLTMDNINTKLRDESLLDSPYDVEERPMTREEKLKSVKIDDMLNPQIIGSQKTGSTDPVEEFLSAKKNFSNVAKNLMKLSFIVAGIVALIIALKIMDIF